MSIATLLTHPVLLKYRQATGQDHYGQPVLEESELSAHCYARLLSTDDADAVSREQIDYRVYLPASTLTDGLFALEIAGLSYEVQGPAHTQFNPRRGVGEYVMVTARRAVS